MDKDTLKKTHALYDTYIDKWLFWEAAYDGGDDFIDHVIKQNERESSSNWEQRK